MGLLRPNWELWFGKCRMYIQYKWVSIFHPVWSDILKLAATNVIRCKWPPVWMVWLAYQKVIWNLRMKNRRKISQGPSKCLVHFNLSSLVSWKSLLSLPKNADNAEEMSILSRCSDPLKTTGNLWKSLWLTFERKLRKNSYPRLTKLSPSLLFQYRPIRKGPKINSSFTNSRLQSPNKQWQIDSGAMF